MGWRWGWSRGGWFGMWPGRGPFSYLPPWERPGWRYGPGSCWWLFGNPWLYSYRYPTYGYYPGYTPYYPYYSGYTSYYPYYPSYPYW